MKKTSIIIGSVTLLGLIACGSAGKPSNNDTNRINEQANNGSTTAPAAPVKKQITAGDWEVGKKENLNAGIITAGTYIVTATEDGMGCYWATVKNFDNSLDSIVANDNLSPGVTAHVVVKNSYAGLHLGDGCLATKKK